MPIICEVQQWEGEVEALKEFGSTYFAMAFLLKQAWHQMPDVERCNYSPHTARIPHPYSFVQNSTNRPLTHGLAPIYLLHQVEMRELGCREFSAGDLMYI